MNFDESQHIIQTAIEKLLPELHDLRRLVRKAIMGKHIWAVFVLTVVLVLVYLVWHPNNFWAALATFVFPAIMLFASRIVDINTYLKPLEKQIATLENEPKTVNDYANRADTLAENEYYAAAELDYRKSLELDSNDIAVKYRLAFVLHLLKRDDESFPLVESILGLEGDCQAETYALYGKLVAKTEPELALENFNKAIRINPKEHWLYLDRADFFLDRAQFQDAKKDLDKAEKLAKSQEIRTDQIHSRRARWFLEQNEPQKALAELNRAITMNSHDPELFKRRAEIHELLGNRDKAEKDRQKAECFEQQPRT